MRRPKKHINIQIVTALLGSLTGCFSTQLPEVPAPSPLPRLVDAAKIQIPLQVTIDGMKDDTVGYQYMLLGLPVSRIHAPNAGSLLRNALTTQAGMAGVGFLTPSNGGLENPRVDVRLSKLRVNGYDFLFFRRPTASVTIVGTFHQQRGKPRECDATAEYAEFAKFAFSDELNRALEQAFDTAARQLVSCLGLSYSQDKL